ncbi:hypothetical protein Angca_005184 [Angiostrongylus cantonensis]|nr:hypothetical protein Angca_005184 [Angiostrongylus cantonensis]
MLDQSTMITSDDVRFDDGSCPASARSPNGFVCGVVEGFYGRPWTFEQRKHLFSRLNRLGLNTYVYAPKDDLKHRPQWRIPYNNEETDILKSLIESAKANKITFVYSLSPGIDIVYSKIEDVICVKSKFDQVRMLGCESFALLFDDIECEMNEVDRQCFKSFVAAQISVANEVYEYLGRPLFLFCPTEYCESRAVPSLADSEYLLQLGKELNENIRVLWTGPRVISRHITIDHVRSVARVIARKPLIWDNLHANDYDQKRVFMGDFSGRPVALKNEISGLLMNPNCKYELNFVPLRTFADWNASTQDAPFNDHTTVDNGNGSVVDSPQWSRTYRPLFSLRNAVLLWADEFNCVSNRAVLPSSQPESKVGSMENSCSMMNFNESNITHVSSAQLEEALKSVVLPSPVDDDITVNSLTADYGEPMETSLATVKKEEEFLDVVENNTDTLDCVMTELDITYVADSDQISMLVDMFYLPFECGRRACELLEGFLWLYENALLMSGAKLIEGVMDITQGEWLRKFDDLDASIQMVNGFFKSVVDCPNKPLVSEIIPYIWDAHGSCSVLLGLARWMKEGFVTARPDEQPHSWRNDREDEPWMIGGGFLSECARLVAPRGPIVRLFNNRTLLPLSIVNYEIRPYTADDLDFLASLSVTCMDESDVSFAAQKEMFLDRFIVPLLDSRPQYCFLAQEILSHSENKLISSVSAHPNARCWFDHIPMYTSSLKTKYASREDNGFKVDHIDKWYPTVPDNIFNQYPAWLDARLLVDAYDSVPTRKMVQVAAAALYINGCSGMFVTIPITAGDHVNFFTRIGFSELGKSVDGRFTMLGHLLSVDEEFRE